MVLSNGPTSVQDPAIQRAIAQVKKSGRKFDDRDFAPESMQWPRSIYNTLNRNSAAWMWMRPDEFLTDPVLFMEDPCQNCSGAKTAPDAKVHQGCGGPEYSS